MSREPRKPNDSGLYHIMIRGTGKQILFEEDSDRFRFLETMKRYKEECKIQLPAYCLMENHVHLLVKDQNKSISLYMKKLETSYAYYFNHKYERVGTVFQDRYKCESIDDEIYFKTVFRYILRNPEKAGLCKTEKYPWSAYSDYAHKPDLADTETAMEVFSDRKALISFVKTENNDQCMEDEPVVFPSELARHVIRDRLNLESATVLKSYPREERDKAIRIMKENGIPQRMISRLTGISRVTISKA